MFAQGTIFKSSFLGKNIGDFYRSATMKKCSTVIACKRNRFDFWNSCKRLQNFVNVEALTASNTRVAHAKTSPSFAPLTVRVQAGCLAFSFYIPTKPLT